MIDLALSERMRRVDFTHVVGQPHDKGIRKQLTQKIFPGNASQLVAQISLNESKNLQIDWCRG